MMSTEPMPDDAERLLEQACAWLSQLHSGEFSTSAQQELNAWRAADSTHEQAWQRAEKLWAGLGQLRGRRVIPGAQPLSGEGGWQAHDEGVRVSRPVAKLDSRLRGNDGLRSLKGRVNTRTRSRRSLTLAVACCALLAVTLTALYPPAFWRADYLTGKGEQRTVTLADGSRVMLNTATALAIHFDDNVRRVELLTGEAFFEVAKNPQRPFVVSSAGSEVRAVGTAFSVQRQSAQTQVELVEGIVEIQDAQQHRERLTAGQSALISGHAIALQAAKRPENMALWRDGYLEFDGLPLHQAVAQINQYRPGRVVLLNPALADKRISGLFRLDALDQAIASLNAAVPELQIVSVTPYLVVLR
ncbi:FecR family protein [Methylomonas sp. MO1]|uniref:FecR family protein n=2 Tax=unclassified Methylomonas TaxID=2608980 RepID=UPI000479AE5A|nr:FecR family protein [Methylomonas sp. MO1]MDT4291075.1 FecR family protein [Methylomonas sp. MO1]